MDGLALIEQAQEAGLKLSAVGGQLVMKGPKRLSPLVALISQNKDSVLAALTTSSPAPPQIDSQLSTSVGVTETPSSRQESGGFADSILANRRKATVSPLSWPTQPPVEILADPIIFCPRCTTGRVLRELRTMTGGVCWQCWNGEQRTKS